MILIEYQRNLSRELSKSTITFNIYVPCMLWAVSRFYSEEMHDNLCNPKEAVKITQQKLKGLLKLQWSVRSKLFYHILDFIFQRFKLMSFRTSRLAKAQTLHDHERSNLQRYFNKTIKR